MLPQSPIRFVCLAILLAQLSHYSHAETPSAVMPAKHTAFFTDHCYECHDEDSKEGGVDLQNLSFDLGNIETAEAWQKVLGAMNSGDMPPEDAEQPPAEAKTEFLATLSKKIVTARKLLSDSGGVITMRRLNRREYANTMRQLLGVEVDVDALPSDENSDGFDTSGASLFFSSDQFEQYLKIARTALDSAIVSGDQPKTKRLKRQAEKSALKMINKRATTLKKQHAKAIAWKKSDKPPTAFGFIDEDRVEFEEGQYDLNYPILEYYLEQPESKTGAILLTTFQGSYIDSTTIPKKPGKYLLRVRAGAFPDAEPERRFLEFGTKGSNSRGGEMIVMGCRQVTGTIEDPQLIEIPVTVSTEGPNNIGLRQRQPNSREYARMVYRRERAKNKIGPTPALWIDWVELVGPIVQQWPPKSHEDIFMDGDDAEETDEYAKQDHHSICSTGVPNP